MTIDPSLSSNWLSVEVERTSQMCREAADPLTAIVAKQLPQGPEDEAAWFDLLAGFARGAGAAKRRLAAMEARLAASPSFPAGAFGRYVVLQALQVALARLPGLSVSESVKWHFFATCAQVAAADALLLPQFELAHPAFYQLANVATLRWMPAGQLSFEFTTVPRSWLLKVHPAALPRFLRELIGGMGGWGPVVTTHLWAWRRTPFLVLRGEFERSLWRIAKSMELCPDVLGLATEGWLYATEIGQQSPHLTWLREFFVEQKAYLVDMGPAPPDSGFLTGSIKRRKLWEEGRFRPRRPLILWPRAAMLSWAQARPDLGKVATSDQWSDMALATGPRPNPTELAEVPASRANPVRRLAGRARRLLDKHPKYYVAAVLVAPAVSASLAAVLFVGWWAGLPTLIAVFSLLWLLQYLVFFK